MPLMHNKDLEVVTFKDQFGKLDWDFLKQSIYQKTEVDVLRAIKNSSRNLDDFAALVSPAAACYLEEIAQISAKTTRQRFGKTVQLYAPLYLSNKCQNICTYCGFSLNNPIRRITLNNEQLHQEACALKKLGFKHVLLVTGEAPRTVGVAYFKEALKVMRQYFKHISIETQPLTYNEYVDLKQCGVDAVMVYQETYNQKSYDKYHLRGNKKDFFYRLETPDRLAQAGIRKVGLAPLIGLEDWRTDVLMTAYHLHYLQQRYWKMRFSISFPRLRPCVGGIEIACNMTNRQLVQLICAWRLFREELDLSLSTRESAYFRDNVLKLGITTMSAASATKPGGYSNPDHVQLEQFSINDSRTVSEVVQAIKVRNMEVIWQDFEFNSFA